MDDGTDVRLLLDGGDRVLAVEAVVAAAVTSCSLPSYDRNGIAGRGAEGSGSRRAWVRLPAAVMTRPIVRAIPRPGARPLPGGRPR